MTVLPLRVHLPYPLVHSPLPHELFVILALSIAERGPGSGREPDVGTPPPPTRAPAAPWSCCRPQSQPRHRGEGAGGWAPTAVESEAHSGEGAGQASRPHLSPSPSLLLWPLMMLVPGVGGSRRCRSWHRAVSGAPVSSCILGFCFCLSDSSLR